MSEPAQRIGPYAIVERIGSGAMATVFHVRDDDGQDRALKLLATSVEGDKARLRLGREGQVTAAIAHPGIVRVHDAGEANGRAYLVYEWVQGEDLRQALPRLSRADRLRILLEIAVAVGHAHDQQVLHRDLKPANVLLDTSDRARVADFGLAQAAGLERLTQTGVAVGTPGYMAPEQMVGDRASYGPPTDVWALGVMLYEALTDRLPFRGQTYVELAAQVSRAAPPSPRSLDPSVSKELERVCLRALSASPGARHPNGAEFAEDLLRARDASARPRSARGALLVAAALALPAGVLLWAVVAPPPPPTQAEAPPERVEDTQPPAQSIPPERVRLTAEGLRRIAQDPALKTLDPLLLSLARTPRPRGVAPSSAELELGNAVVRNAYGLLDADLQRGLEVLRLLGRSGLRTSDRAVGLKLLNQVYGLGVLRSIAQEDYARFLIAAARLDLPLHQNDLRENTQFFRAADLPTRGEDEPWSRYLRARIHADQGPQRIRHKARQDLRLYLGQDAPIELGPRVWGQTAALIVRAIDPHAALVLLGQAQERDPASPWLLSERSNVLWALGRHQESLKTLDEARRAFVAAGLRNTLGRAHAERFMLKEKIYRQAELGDREGARASFAEVTTLSGTDFLREIVRDHPWLEE